MDKQNAINSHLSKEISRLYDVVISLTERIERIEKYLCTECNSEHEPEKLNG